MLQARFMDCPRLVWALAVARTSQERHQSHGWIPNTPTIGSLAFWQRLAWQNVWRKDSARDPVQEAGADWQAPMSAAWGARRRPDRRAQWQLPQRRLYPGSQAARQGRTRRIALADQEGPGARSVRISGGADCPSARQRYAARIQCIHVSLYPAPYTKPEPRANSPMGQGEKRVCRDTGIQGYTIYIFIFSFIVQAFGPKCRIRPFWAVSKMQPQG